MGKFYSEYSLNFKYSLPLLFLDCVITMVQVAVKEYCFAPNLILCEGRVSPS